MRRITPFSLLNPPSLREFLSDDEVGASLDGWYDLRAAHEKAIAAALPPTPAERAEFLRSKRIQALAASLPAVAHSRDCTCPGELPGQLHLDDQVAELPCRRCGSMAQAFPCPDCGARDARNPAIPLLDEVPES